MEGSKGNEVIIKKYKNEASTVPELLTALESSKDVELINDIDLAGLNSILITSKVDLGGFTVFANELFSGGDLFLFLLQGGVIGNGKIIRPNGDWARYCFYGNNIKLKASGVGQLLYDDHCRNDVGETFETTSKIKLSSPSGGAFKSGRFNGDAASGAWCFRLQFPISGSVFIE